LFTKIIDVGLRRKTELSVVYQYFSCV